MNGGTPGAARVTIVTPTYRPDLEMTRELCASIDRHLKTPFRHLVIVPRRDVSRFAPLATTQREVIVAERLLRPHGFHRLPLPLRIRIPGLIDRRLREQWWKPGTGRVTGWLIQQMLKLQSAELTDDELIVFIDSDVSFVRDVDAGLLHVDGRVRLHRTPGKLASEGHHRWRAAALALIGLADGAADRVSYIGNVVTWRRSNLVALLARIEAVTGTDWRTAVARTRALSEYMLYGYFAEYLLPDRGGHVVEPFGAVHSLWTRGDEALVAFVAGLTEAHVAVHIQSTVIAGRAERQRIIRAALDHAEARA